LKVLGVSVHRNKFSQIKEQSSLTNWRCLGIFYELYLDDLIIFGKTKKEFAENVKKILEHLRAHNITCIPEKCRFGHDSIEYLGHVIDSTGMTFSRKEKKQEVRNFPRPKFLKQLQRFLGLVNYFDDHIRNLPTEVASSGLCKLLKDSLAK
jgi:hypothetical protein